MPRENESKDRKRLNLLGLPSIQLIQASGWQYNTAFQLIPPPGSPGFSAQVVVFPVQFSISLPAFEQHLLVTRSRSQSIRNNARCILGKFARFVEGQGRACTPDAAPELVRQFLVSFTSPVYRYTAIYYLRLFFDFLAWPVNPARLVKLPKINPASSRKFLESGECQALLDVLKGHVAQGKHLREQLIVHLVLFTGLRAGEALALKWEDIGAGGSILVRDSKTHTPRVVYIPVPVLRLLESYRQVGPPSRWVFPGRDAERPLAYGTLRALTKALLGEAGIDRKGLNLHSLRHTYARACVEAGMPRETIQRFLGHRDVQTTAIYTQLLPEDIRRSSPQAHGAMRRFLRRGGAQQRFQARGA